MASKCLRAAKFLRSNRSFTAAAAASPFAGRYHSFSSSAAPNDHTCSRSTRGKVLQNTSTALMRHPFLKQGLKMMCSADEYELQAIVKVDMPGIGKECLNLRIRNNAIHIEAKAEKEPEDEEHMLVRTYSGLVALPPGFYNTDQIKASMNGGVLKVVVPKLKPEEMMDSSLIPPPIQFHGQWLPWI